MRSSLLLCAVALSTLVSLPPAHAANTLRVDVHADVSYDIYVNEVAWLTSSETFVTVQGRRYSSADGSLKLQSLVQKNGTDSSGAYVRHEATWAAGQAQWVTVIKVYDTQVVFGQHFPTALEGTSVPAGSNDVLSSFPSFMVASYSAGRRGYLSFQGDMCGSGAHTGEWDDDTGGIGAGIAGSGPIVVFNEDASASVVLGAYSNFMIHSQSYTKPNLQYGVLGSVTSVPAGFIVETLLTVSEGVNTAMLGWGDQLLARYGKQRYAYQNDYILTHLGYSTDNGAYYYYQTAPAMNYEDTLLAVKAYADTAGIPYRHVLLDSWWYFKGTGSGVATWDAMPSVFPHGLEYLYNATGWVQQLHNRYWAANTTYAKQNGGQWDFLIESDRGIALPTDPQFWDMLLGDKRNTGMFMYEQDWLDVQFDKTAALQQSATLARQWMMQMGEAAARVGVTMQECMSHVRHVLQSVELPAITNARASGDYHPGNTQWNIGTSSILAHAVGIAPSKDNYWSTPVQSDTHYGPDTREPYNRLQSAVSSFSTGPVAPSDKIGSSDVPLILRGCMSDGTLLQPSVPATALDAHFLNIAFGSGGVDGEVWSSYTQLPNYRVAYVLAIDVHASYDLPLLALGFAADTVLAASEANASATVATVDATHPLHLAACGRADFQLFTLSPVIGGGYALLGEPDKWVRVSRQRFSNLVVDDAAGLSVDLRGAAGEAVKVGVLVPGGAVLQPQCVINQDGSARLTVSPAGVSSCLPL